MKKKERMKWKKKPADYLADSKHCNKKKAYVFTSQLLRN